MLYRNREKPLTQSTTSIVNETEGEGPQVYGSNRAGTFLSELFSTSNNRAHLDVILIGDSNTGSSVVGGYGYLAGMSEALNNLGSPCYGTPIAPFIDRCPISAYRFYSNWRGTQNTLPKDSNYKSGLQASTSTPTDADAVPYAVWNANSPLVSYGSATSQATLTNVSTTSITGDFLCDSTYLQINQPVNISGTFGGAGGAGTLGGSIVGYTPPSAGQFRTYYINSTNGTTTFSLSETHNGNNVVTVVGAITGATFLTGADFNDWLYLPSTGATLYQTKGINLDETHPLSQNGVTNFLRVRYGKMPNGGRFIPLVFSNGAENGREHLLTGSTVGMSEAGGQPSFYMYEASFTANGKGHVATALGYNYPSGTVFTSGPGALFCQSLYRKQKGWAVHSHSYLAGDDSTRIANVLDDTSTWLQYQLQEIRERQISAGGLGRVLLFCHSGINGADTDKTWVAAHQKIWDKYKRAWASLSYPAADLAIISIVGVQRNSADTSANNADLIPVRQSANLMAIRSSDMTVVDVKKLMPYAALTYGSGVSSYYQQFSNTPNIASDTTVHLAGGGVSVDYGTATTTTATSITLTGNLAVAANGYWNGSRLYIYAVNGSSSPPAYQDTTITQYNGSTKVATVNQWTGGQPTNGVSSSIAIVRKHPADGYTAVSQAILSSLIS